MRKDEDKTDVLNAFFSSLLISKANCSQGTQPPELEGGVRGQDETPVIQWELSVTSLHLLNVCKCMGLCRIHPRVLKELAEVHTKTLSIIYHQL